MQKCTFCGKEYDWPRGLTYVTSEGKISYFCSSKCRKNILKLKRDKLKMHWVKKSNWNKSVSHAWAAVSRDYEAKKLADAAKVEGK